MAANAPPSLLIIKTETESEAPMFNLLLCKLFEGWLYGNCSLVLYIYRCTLCQGQGSCVGFILSFQGSVSEAICETGQIKLVLTSFFFFFLLFCGGVGLQVPPQEPVFWMLLGGPSRAASTDNVLTNYPKPSFEKSHFSELNRSIIDFLH